MSACVQEIVDVLSEQDPDQMDAGTMELLHFLVQSLRDAKLAAAAAHGILQLIAADESYRSKFRKLGVESAVLGLHFFGSEMSELAAELVEMIQLQEDVSNPVAETWEHFRFSAERGDLGQQIEVSVKVKLSAAHDATRLSSHGWRVWPGAQILSQWLVSHANLKGMDVVEVGAGPGVVGLVAASLGATVTLTDRCHAVLAALQQSVQENRLDSVKLMDLDWESPESLSAADMVLASEDLLPALLQKILRPGGRFCACEQSGRSQDGIYLFPLFCDEMKERGFIQVLEEKHQLEDSDLEFVLFEFRAP